MKRRSYQGHLSSSIADIYLGHVTEVAIDHSVHRNRISGREPIEGSHNAVNNQKEDVLIDINEKLLGYLLPYPG